MVTLSEDDRRLASDPCYQAFGVLRVAFTVAPILAGIDKFTDYLVDWNKYLSPLVTRTLGMSASTFMMIVGVVEIIAGLIVAARPRIGAWIVCAWLCGIIINLLTIPGFYDVALRDLGLALGAVALARLAALHDRPAVVAIERHEELPARNISTTPPAAMP